MVFHATDEILTSAFICFLVFAAVDGDSVWPIGFKELNLNSLRAAQSSPPWKKTPLWQFKDVTRLTRTDTFCRNLTADKDGFKKQLDALEVFSDEVHLRLRNQSSQNQRVLNILHERYVDYPFDLLVNTNDQNKIPKPCAREMANGAKVYEEFCRVTVSHGKSVSDFPDQVVRELTNQTVPIRVCDPFYKYRSANGSCNNLQHPAWVEAPHRFERLLAPVYEDGISEPRGGKTNCKLPSPRLCSTTFALDVENPDETRTQLFVFFGQIIAHDITMTPADQPALKDNDVISCCDPEARNLEQCLPISIPKDDYFFGPLNVTCMDFARSIPAPCDEDCLVGYREQLNQETAIIDGSFIYGSDQSTQNDLRLFKDGLLRSEKVGDQEVCMFSKKPEKDRCSDVANGKICSFTGDSRSNQNLVLASFHIMWLREHNRIAKELKKLNPHWDDETLFQESRRIVIAELQHITYKEYLPLLIGSETMDKYQLGPLTTGYSRYNASVKANLLNEFSTGFFRLHSTVNNTFRLHDVNLNDSSVSVHLKGNFFKSFLCYNNSHEFIQGVSNAYSQQKDSFHANEMTNRLYSTKSNQAMFDIVAINIQRGRDHGIAPFVDYVKAILGIDLKCWEELEFWFSRREIGWLRKLYNDDIKAIDLYVGLQMEQPVWDGAVGPTQAEIIGYQFNKLKFGDRFFYEHDTNCGFTIEQLETIRSTTSLARLFRDNYPEVNRLKKSPFLLDSPVVEASLLPHLNLNVFQQK